MGMATVYRNLKALVEAGQLVPVQISGEPPRYERMGKNTTTISGAAPVSKSMKSPAAPETSNRSFPKGSASRTTR